jgi:hypothetical protein
MNSVEDLDVFNWRINWRSKQSELAGLPARRHSFRRFENSRNVEVPLSPSLWDLNVLNVAKRLNVWNVWNGPIPKRARSIDNS